MRISGAAIGGGELSNSKKAAIKRQIRKLEKKRDEILEKLGVKTSSKKQDSPGISTGVLRLNTAGSDGQASASTPQSGGDGVESGSAAPQANTFFGNSQDIGSALRELSNGSSSSSATNESEIPEDPKELMKLLQLIIMQIATLRQQLGDDSLEPVEMDQEEAATLAAAGMEAREADKAAESVAALPMAEMTAEGHLDGYA